MVQCKYNRIHCQFRVHQESEAELNVNRDLNSKFYMERLKEQTESTRDLNCNDLQGESNYKEKLLSDLLSICSDFLEKHLKAYDAFL